MPKAILTLNAGSSSIKFALYECVPGRQRLVSHGVIEGIGTAPRFTVRAPDGTVLEDYRWAAGIQLGHEDLLKPLLTWVTSHLGQESLVAVGHRIVHGGSDFHRPTRIDDAVLAALEKLVPLAPLHQPHNIAAVKAISSLRPDLLQVACFDTAFHHDMPPVATRLALPQTYTEEGVRRYGFHGLSYEYLIARLRELSPDLAGGRVVAAHLGNGASLCAMRNGRSIDTTMGFTALDGLVMGTRCGSIDPGALLYLQQVHDLRAVDVEYMLYHESGLLGVSGISSDMRILQVSEDPRAREAIELFVYRLVKELGALTSALGGLDALIFSAGIGEHAASVRAAVCERLAWLGIECDPAANARHDTLISTSRSRVRVFIIATDEEAMIAAHTAHALAVSRE
ncbi:acetate kinase [Rhodanobacter sp. B05]|jgi:acetate kinase|uniref:acetate/propionate family kinase n=1 Tax=Rhodanobacter sp. B05 TaxID=1945859 RepID=UPI0009860DB8|nr:acetate/propionate family kinase [Rhodanobacter sp. B05]OOG55139.1 acetate kinase [Rhodanobacter sp. B05]